MVLESIINPIEAEKHPSEMLFVGFVYSSLGLFLALWIFGGDASIASVFLTTMPLIVVMVKAIMLEEKKDKEFRCERFLIKEHCHILSFFLFLFIGMLISYSFWFTILPDVYVGKAFNSQLEAISAIRGNVGATGHAIQNPALGRILANNLKVLAFCILFSFLYGAGAIFILTWNASVIGAAIGNVFRTVIVRSAGIDHKIMIFTYIQTFPIGLSYLVHGIPEVLAYFLGALAGGIISVAVVNHDYRTKKFRHIVIDSVDLIIASAILLLMASLIEVYVTPSLL